MQSNTATIINERGLHARASGKLAELAKTFHCHIEVSYNKQQADAKNILQLMMLAAAKGSELTLSCDGSDEDIAITAICQLINTGFDEGE